MRMPNEGLALCLLKRNKIFSLKIENRSNADDNVVPYKEYDDETNEDNSTTTILKPKIKNPLKFQLETFRIVSIFLS